MKKYRIIFKYSQSVAERTMTFYFEKPKGFSSTPGQYIVLSPVREQTNSHTFSIASAPYEQTIMIATRMRKTAYKKFLRSLKSGDEVTLQSSGGMFILPEDTSKTIVFLAGGIGVTPVRSMVLAETRKNSPRKIYLFYSNRRPEDTVFLEELKNIKNGNFKLVPTMTEMANSDVNWNGEEGYITMKMIKKYVNDTRETLYFVVGPPGFVEAMGTVLRKAGIENSQIVTDEFHGY